MNHEITPKCKLKIEDLIGASQQTASVKILV